MDGQWVAGKRVGGFFLRPVLLFVGGGARARF